LNVSGCAAGISFVSSGSTAWSVEMMFSNKGAPTEAQGSPTMFPVACLEVLESSRQASRRAASSLATSVTPSSR
jgi:hypothetical protein